MKLSESQLREIVRYAISELFVRPKKRTPILKRALSAEYMGPGDDDDYLSGDITGFGEFDEADDEAAEEAGSTTKGTKKP